MSTPRAKPAKPKRVKTPKPAKKKRSEMTPKEKRRQDGREWQDKIRDAAKVFCRFSHNPNALGSGWGASSKTSKKPGDRIIFPQGRGTLIEAKDCETPVLRRSKFQYSEEQALWEVATDKAQAIVAIRWKVNVENDAFDRAWLCHYTDLISFMRGRGEAQVRWDKEIPPFFVEMERRRYKGRGVRWDLGVALAELANNVPSAPYHIEPLVEFSPQIAAEKLKKKQKKESDKTKREAESAALVAAMQALMSEEQKEEVPF